MNDKAKFWIRFSTWALLSCVLPFVFIAFRFKLFESKSVSFTGFGVLAIVILAIFVISLLSYVRKGLPYSMFSQCITGFCKITLPLVALLAVIWCIRNNTEDFIKVLGFVVISETLAIPVNPMPKWIHENIQKDTQEKIEGTADLIINKVFARKEEKK